MVYARSFCIESYRTGFEKGDRQISADDIGWFDRDAGVWHQHAYLFLRRSALVFFCLGYYLVKYDIHFTDLDRVLTPPQILIPFILGIIGKCVFENAFLEHLSRMTAIIFGILFFIRFTTNISNEVWNGRLLRLAKYSFPIYIFHQLSLTILLKLEMRYLPETLPFQLFSYFGTIVIIVTFCVCVSKFLERFQPRLYGIITGNRRV